MMDAEAVALLRAHHAYFVPTLYTSASIAENPTVPESEKARSTQISDLIAKVQGPAHPVVPALAVTLRPRAGLWMTVHPRGGT